MSTTTSIHKDDTLLFSIVVTTRNRKDELRRCLDSCFAQRFDRFEVLVYDDASDDGTDDMVRSEFPTARLFRRELRQGLIVRRNEALRDVSSPWIISLDDDAYLTSTATLQQLSEIVNSCDRTAAWALAFCEPLTIGPRMLELPTGTQLCCYMGGVHAIRRQVALSLGGYPELLVHQGEERDLAIRILENGWHIRYAQTPLIVHLCSPQRDLTRIHYYGYRNTILFSWMRVPFPEMLVRMFRNSATLLFHRMHWKNIHSKIYALGSGYVNCIRYWRQRDPVRQETYRLFQTLPNHGPCAVQNDPPIIPPAKVEVSCQ